MKWWMSAGVAWVGLVGGCASCGSCRDKGACATGPAGLQGAQAAQHAYKDAINANDLEAILAVMTEDVVFMPPNGPRVVGKAAVREWAAPYMQAYTIHWDNTQLEFLMIGDGYALEQSSYVEHDVANDGSGTLDDTGKGVILYKRGGDAVWRVALDIWCSDLPAE
ncbi:MAG: DUF4440 domain-containing protein [Phycisphaerales bacterium]